MRGSVHRWVALLVLVIVTGGLATSSSSTASAQPEPVDISIVCVDRITSAIRAVSDAGDCTRYEFAFNLQENFPYTLCVNRINATMRLGASGCSSVELAFVVPDDLPISVCVNRINGRLSYRAPGRTCPRGTTSGNVAIAPPEATDDAYTTGEDTPVSGNVITDDTGSGADSDPSGFPLSVTEVNGDEAAIGITYNLASGATVAMQSTGDFSYDPNGAFEFLAVNESDEDSFEYTVFNGFNTDTATVTLTITGVNDAPTAIDLSDATVDENVPLNTPVGTFSTTDPDTSDTHTYSLVVGDGDDDNASFVIAGNELQTNAVIDYETQDSYSIRVRTDDGNGGALEEQFTIAVNDVNDAPTAIQLDPADVDENDPAGAFVGSFTTTDQDAGDTHTYDLVPGAGDDNNASFTIIGAELFTTETFDFETQSGYAIRVSSTDQDGLSVEQQFTITVNDVNEAPDAVDDTDNVTEEAPNDADPNDNTAIGNVLTNDTDPESDTLTVSAVEGSGGNVAIPVAGVYGSVVVGADGAYIYTLDDSNPAVDALAPGDTLIEDFEYTVSDGLLTDTATLTFTIHGANDLPTAVDDSNQITEEAPNDPNVDNAVSGNVLDNDADPDGPALTVTNAGTIPGQYGTLVLSADGVYTYTLDDDNLDVNGLGENDTLLDNFSYTISDGDQTDTGALDVTINGANDPPVATDDTNLIPEQAPNTLDPDDNFVSGNVLTDDSDPDSPILTVTDGGTIPGQYGELVLGSDGNYTYTLDDDNSSVNGLTTGEQLIDSFSYTVSDGDQADTGALDITIQGADDPPDAVSDDASVVEEAPNDADPNDNTAIGSVLTNDTDPESDTLTVSAVEGSGGNVAIPVAGVYGSLVLDAGGNFTYILDDANPTVDALDVGDTLIDDFSYTASDGSGTDTATLTITIEGANDPPTAVDNTATIFEEAPNDSDPANNTETGDVLANDDDPEGATLSVTEVNGSAGNVGVTVAGAYGELVLNGNGSFTYTLDDDDPTVNGLVDNESLNDVFTYTMTDGDATDSATLTITIQGANDPPTVESASFLDASGENGIGNTYFGHGLSAPAGFASVIIPGSLTFTDPEGAGPLTVISTTPVTPNSNELIEVNDDGSFSYIPATGFEGTAEFEYTVQDADAEQATGTVTIEFVEVVWYINNAPPASVPIGAGNDGRSSSPFNDLSDYSAATGPAVGDVIFVHSGSASYDGGITLLDSQQLLGEGSGLVVDSQTLVPAGTAPVLTNSGGDAVTVASGNTLKGFDIGGTTTGDGITGSGVTGGTVEDVAISGVGGAGVSLASAGGTFTFTTTTSISNAAGTGFSIDGGAGSVDYDGTITNAAGRTVEVLNKSGGTVSFDGAISDSGGTGINLSANPSTTISFTGGVSLSTGANAAFSASNSGTVNITGGTNTVSTTTGDAVTIQNTLIGGDGVAFQSITTNGAANGILLTNAGSGAFNGGGGAIQNATSRGVDVEGGAGNVTYNGSISTTSTGRSVEVTGHTGGVVSFGGAVTDSGLGINLTGNTNATLNFSNTLTLITATNTAFNAGSGGTVNVTGSGNTITTTTGTGLAIDGTTIGSSDVTFRSISVNGAPNGILLNNTGTQGGLTVTGDGTGTVNGTGGTIQSTTGDGISLTNARDVSISQLNISTSGDHGIDIQTVTNFTYQDATIIGVGNADDEHSVKILNLFGTSLIEDVTFDNINEDGIEYINDAADDGNRDILTVRRVSFEDHTTAGHGEHGIDVQAQTSALMGLVVDSSTFTLNGEAALGVIGQSIGSSNLSITIQGSTFDATNAFGAGTIQITNATNSTGTNVINGNILFGSELNSIVVNNDDAATSFATITNNDVDTVVSSSNNVSIQLRQDDGNGTFTALVSGNTIDGGMGHVVNVITRSTGGAGTMNVTIQNNQIGQTTPPGDFATGVYLNSQQSNTLCANISGNLITSGASIEDILLEEQDTSTMNITQASAADLSTQNNGATVLVSIGSPTFGAPACPLP